jgi:hypothetical protein
LIIGDVRLRENEQFVIAYLHAHRHARRRHEMTRHREMTHRVEPRIPVGL